MRSEIGKVSTTRATKELHTGSETEYIMESFLQELLESFQNTLTIFVGANNSAHSEL